MFVVGGELPSGEEGGMSSGGEVHDAQAAVFERQVCCGDECGCDVRVSEGGYG